MALNREYTGRSWTSPEVYVVAREKIRDYAHATGDLDPVHLDEAEARRRGHPGIVAPPTFVSVLWARMNTWPLREPDINREKEPNMVIGDMRIVHHRPVHAGDRLRFSTTVTDIREIGGKHEVMEVRHEIASVDGEPVCTITEAAISRDVVNRSGGPRQ